MKTLFTLLFIAICISFIMVVIKDQKVLKKTKNDIDEIEKLLEEYPTDYLSFVSSLYRETKSQIIFKWIAHLILISTFFGIMIFAM